MEQNKEPTFEERLEGCKLKRCFIRKRDVSNKTPSRNGFNDFEMVFEYEEPQAPSKS